MAREKRTMDGNMAAAYVSYGYTESAVIYPITPSSPMADYTDLWTKQGKENIFGQKVLLTQMQSEAGVAGAMHGALLAGALTTTFTASQGLLLMLPNLYKMAGEMLPGVIQVSARTVASHALSIFGDQSDIYACRQTGVAILCSGNVQEVMDLSVVVHRSAIRGSHPFIHFFDGFRTSHELKKIELWDYKELAEMCDNEAVERFHRSALNPEHPFTAGTAQNPDVFFQMREATNGHYVNLISVVEEAMEQVNSRIGRSYRLFEYYGDAAPDVVMIAMGSVCDTIEETIDYLRKNGEKNGLVKVRLYRPFSKRHLLEAIPDSVKKIVVLDRTKEPGAPGEPLFQDVVAALKGSGLEKVPVFAGRYGLSSKDTLPGDIAAAFHQEEKKQFTLGITDDVTQLSLQREIVPDASGEDIYQCKFWGLGSDGTVGANKNSIKIIGDNTDLEVQAYFDYDSKKSGGLTISHLRFGKRAIKSAYVIYQADFVACHNPNYVNRYPILEELKEGGIFLLNTSVKKENLEEFLHTKVKKLLAEKKIRFYLIDGFGISKELGLGGRINTVLQASFFKLTGIIPPEKALQYMKEAAEKSYGAKGEEVVLMNWKAIEAGMELTEEVKVPERWGISREEAAKTESEKQEEPDRKENGKSTHRLEDYVNHIQNPIYRLKGNELPVSVFCSYADGKVPNGSAAYEKRGIALEVPEWIPENCIQCTFCSFVCPHATIRPVIVEKQSEVYAQTKDLYGWKSAAKAPEHMFAIGISPLDCTGCGSCVAICPGKKGEKALVMKQSKEDEKRQEFFNLIRENEISEEVLSGFADGSLKSSQLKRPLLEFSGACAGCGETPYAKLLTQLFGESMYIANATGCSSIWGASFPSTPYVENTKGRGPAWANSLFEDNAEFGFGMFLAEKARRHPVIDCVRKLKGMEEVPHGVREAAGKYLDTVNVSRETVRRQKVC